ncbi:hypothetical protein ACWF99_03600 [Nocardia sp. NPDC055002]
MRISGFADVGFDYFLYRIACASFDGGQVRSRGGAQPGTRLIDTEAET